MKEYKRYLVTSALPYANGPVHIGHLAGVYIPSDIYTRYLRLKGKDVIHVCGSDEHGVPITLKAKKEGVTPQVIVDRYHEIIKSSFEGLGISFDIFSRTTTKTHYEVASGFFKKLYDEGKFIEQTSEQYWDPEAGQFLADRYIVGTCPRCGADGAYGDQCEKCGATLSPTELLNPHSAISGATPQKKPTKHWYLPLDQYQTWLEQWILKNHGAGTDSEQWRPNVYGQCKSWLDGGLLPRAVSRDLEWGIPVPVEGAQGKVLYVWFDAPIGYISATKDLTPDWEKYWKSEDTKLVHFIGKDNIVFHCIVFPSMLKAHGEYILPENVPANEFLNLEGQKISTSRNWAVWLNEYLEELPGKQDVLRYVLCACAPETKDNDFTWKEYQSRNNSELVAIFGNFVNRALVLTGKYFDSKVPAISSLTDYDNEVLQEIPRLIKVIGDNIETYHFREALREMMNLARLGNKYLTDTEPWKAAKTDMDRTATILNVALQITANLAVVCEPFMPFTSKKLRDMLQMNPMGWDEIGGTILSVGHQIGKVSLLFEKIEDELIEKQLQRLEDTKKANELSEKKAPSQKSEIQFDDFQKMDIRVSTILSAEKVEKSKKLLKLQVDTGIDKRTIVSGIAEHFKPEELIGKQVLVLVNLAPRKLMGIESKGMILMAESLDGSLSLLSAPGKIDEGSVVG